MRGAGATTTIPALLVAAATAAGTNAQPAEVTDPVAMAERAVSLGDQAVDVLTGVPPVEWLTSLFGVPSQEQKQRALHAAGEIYRLAGEADIEVRRAVAAIESGPGYAHDIAAQFQRRRLVDNERRRRIPMLRGVGAYLHAALSPQLRERQELYEEAIDLLTNLMKNPSLPFAAKVKLYAGLANVGAEHFETASPLLRGVPALPGADRWDVFASRMGQVSVVRGLRGIDPALAELDAVEQGYGAADPFRILIADRRFRLLSKAARDASGDRGTALLRRAFEAYAALLAEDPVPDNARSAVMERLSRLVDARTPLDGLPEIVSIARARQLAQADATRPEAIALLEALLERTWRRSPERPEALFELAWTLYNAGRTWQAYEQFRRLVREHPAAARAWPAIENAVTIAHGLLPGTPDDPARRTALRESLELLLARSSATATADHWRYVAGRLALDEQRYNDAARHLDRVRPDSPWWPDAQFGRAEIMCLLAGTAPDDTSRADAYRRFLEGTAQAESALAQALTDAAGPRADDLDRLLTRLSILRAEAFLALDEPQRALDELQPIDDDNPLAAAAIPGRTEAYRALGGAADDEHELQRIVDKAGDLAGRILTDLIRSLRPPIDALLEQGHTEEAAARAEQELLAPAALLDRWLDTAAIDAGTHPAWHVEAAEAYRLAERWEEALRLYNRLLRATPNLTAASFGKAECLFGMGDSDVEAFGLYKEVSSVNEYFWLSHLRMLEILSHSNRHTSKIAPEIQRLRQKDPDLGGERYRRKFERLEGEHSGTPR